MNYPAEFTAHWVSGPVFCCERHCQALVNLGAAMGVMVTVTSIVPEDAQCKNCENEDAKRAAAPSPDGNEEKGK